MKNEQITDKKLITYEEICEEAFKPTIDLMMKKYNVLSMTNEQLGDAYQEVKDAVENGSEEFKIAYEKVISELIRRYNKRKMFDVDTHPDVIETKKKELVDQRICESTKQVHSDSWGPYFDLGNDNG